MTRSAAWWEVARQEQVAVPVLRQVLEQGYEVAGLPKPERGVVFRPLWLWHWGHVALVMCTFVCAYGASVHFVLPRSPAALAPVLLDPRLLLDLAVFAAGWHVVELLTTPPARRPLRRLIRHWLLYVLCAALLDVVLVGIMWVLKNGGSAYEDVSETTISKSLGAAYDSVAHSARHWGHRAVDTFRGHDDSSLAPSLAPDVIPANGQSVDSLLLQNGLKNGSPEEVRHLLRPDSLAALVHNLNDAALNLVGLDKAFWRGHPRGLFVTQTADMEDLEEADLPQSAYPRLLYAFPSGFLDGLFGGAVPSSSAESTAGVDGGADSRTEGWASAVRNSTISSRLSSYWQRTTFVYALAKYLAIWLVACLPYVQRLVVLLIWLKQYFSCLELSIFLLQLIALYTVVSEAIASGTFAISGRGDLTRKLADPPMWSSLTNYLGTIEVTTKHLGTKSRPRTPPTAPEQVSTTQDAAECDMSPGQVKGVEAKGVEVKGVEAKGGEIGVRAEGVKAEDVKDTRVKAKGTFGPPC
ncbi:putative transmembrane protein [Gregarina niphandrodes]|uniref:Transmembrane protein n=1 Tax=Gregarina niphandrodes TaxID=110365 RepID=A0A023B9N7_GRENI|nr:putative transmembrane protein [Gregarina niphandrodes]EZG73414.1 putative transmembrane protein [Gregarina niphandrodes]|eukprot:XP_011129652.1 putative transmembrane protein [Gregarina niphandrodes]